MEQASFLQFWTYSFQTNDLFLDQAVEFDGPLSQVVGDPDQTERVYLQMQRDQSELIVFNPDGTLHDKIDQSQPIQAVLSYDKKVLVLVVEQELVYFNLQSKKILRKISLSKFGAPSSAAL